MLQVIDVSKNYGKKEVLKNISINFEDNYGVYGLLGRNGVGKSTLMKISNHLLFIWKTSYMLVVRFIVITHFSRGK
ncbi:hypothetical protein HMPREF9318_01927 [Streptococcus urinalis FB127-CNA-2]|uniref:ATP-binding cassette domain-containing protein n=1 Tax=Streptococcus urinalis TaxID=149016 RepID=UPI000225D974|nr:ATP-binding cassette domain-containing protein [Streptococcus urinalis]EKS17478.1 hypothetical protein HMPREF9318_01927 [Streptococcus urinalis FB127-CNA-2]VEF32700.1 ABC transporter ATP-binding protein [Streptococcus urinalis]